MRFWPGLTGTIAYVVLCTKEASSAVQRLLDISFTGVEYPNLDDGFLAGCLGVCMLASSVAIGYSLLGRLMNQPPFL